MPSSLKNFKTKLFSSSKDKSADKSGTSKSKKKRKSNDPSPSPVRRSSMPPAPATSQTPPARKRLGQTIPSPIAVRTSAPAAIGTDIGLSTSMRSLPSSRSPNSSRLHLDGHKQIKDLDRPEEPAHSSDPDTSLFEYEDDNMELSTTLRRSMSTRYGSDGGRLHTGNSAESIDTIGMSHGKTSPSGEELSVPVIETIQKSHVVRQRGSPLPLLTIPRSASPLHSLRGSAHGTSRGDSLRDSLEASMRSRADQDLSLRRSVESIKDQLDEHVHELAQTIKDKSLAVTEQDKLRYYKQFESNTEQTMRDQENLIKQQNARIENLQDTVEDYRKYKDTTENELKELNETLTTQNNNLGNLVYKLNQEVSYCQTHHQLVRDPNGNRVAGLPDDAPTPAWMVNFKYLSPLIKSLEDQVAMKTQELESLKRKFVKYETDIRSLVAENDNLRATLKSGGSDPEAIHKKAWSQLQQQALLVLEENEVLLKKFDVQDEKIYQMHEQHHYELTQLEDKVRKVEAERQALLQRLTDTSCQLALSKSRCQELTNAMALKVDREEHERVGIEYRTKLESLREERERDKDLCASRLDSLKSENDNSEAMIDQLNDELNESKHEIRRKEKAMNTLEEDCAALTREVKKGRDIVANLLLVTDEAVHERQSMKHFLQSENKEKKKSVGAIIESEIVKEKVVDSYKKYKVKAEQQIDKLMNKLEKQAGEFDVERREYERQIKHLRLTVHDKDARVHEVSKDKQEVEECLEFVWKATQSDNHDMSNTVRRSVRESRDRHLSKFLMDDWNEDVLRVSD